MTVSSSLEIGPLQATETRDVAELHFRFFGGAGRHGISLAMLGAEFLATAFYEPNLDNPYFFVDVARYDGELVGFSVYTTDHRRVFKRWLRDHFRQILLASMKCSIRHPMAVAANLRANLPFLTESLPADTSEIPGWFILLGVTPPFRTAEFRRRTGVSIAREFQLRLERVLLAHGCADYWAAPSVENVAINKFFERINATLFAQRPLQGVMSNFYRVSTARVIGPEESFS